MGPGRRRVLANGWLILLPLFVPLVGCATKLPDSVLESLARLTEDRETASIAAQKLVRAKEIETSLYDDGAMLYETASAKWNGWVEFVRLAVQTNQDLDKNEGSVGKPADPSQLTPEIIEAATERAQKTIIAQSERYFSFSGPLPPPDDLKKYNEILPGAADRIMTMAEKEQSHRHDSDRILIEGEIRTTRFGQVFGFIIALFGFGVAIFMAYLGLSWASFGVFFTTIGSIVYTFVTGKKKRKGYMIS